MNRENDPMPAVQTEVERIDLAEREKEHKEDQPRECGFEGQKEPVTNDADEHRKPEGVGIKQTFDIGDW